METAAPALPPVVVIDDDPLHLDMLVTLLERHGYGAAGFTVSRDALYHLIDHPAALAVVDLCMPDMDGLDLVRRLQVSCPDLPVVAISGHDHAGPSLRAMRDAGAVTALRKPLLPAGFIQAVKNAIAKSGGAAKGWALA
jgi:FixJ family two-component response regulator